MYENDWKSIIPSQLELIVSVYAAIYTLKLYYICVYYINLLVKN